MMRAPGPLAPPRVQPIMLPGGGKIRIVPLRGGLISFALTEPNGKTAEAVITAARLEEIYADAARAYAAAHSEIQNEHNIEI